MSEQYQVTSVGVTPAEDRAHRMKLYFIAMTIRVLCIVSLFWVRGWWILLAAAGAVLLPYFAVMWANAVDQGREGARPDPPTPLAISGTPVPPAEMAADSHGAVAQETIVIDVDEYRRTDGEA